MSAPTQLRKLKISKVDLVDNGADAHAKVAFYKQAGLDSIRARWDGPGSVREVFSDHIIVEAEDGTLSRVSYTTDEDGRVSFGVPTPVMIRYVPRIPGVTRPNLGTVTPGDVSEVPDIAKSHDQEDTTMGLSKEAREGLPEDVRKHLETVEAEKEELSLKVKELTETEETPPEDVTKRDDLPEEVRVALEKRDAELDELREEIAKRDKERAEERRIAIEKDYRSRIDELGAIKLEDEEATSLAKRLASFESADDADVILKALRSADEQAKLGRAFESVGTDASTSMTDSEHQLEGIAKKISTDRGVSLAKGWEIAINENAELYDRVVSEKGA